MSKTFVIRIATEADAEGILLAHHSAVHQIASKDYDSEIIQQWSPEVNAERISKYLENSFPQETTIVAVLNNRIAGFGSIVDRNDELRAVYVAADAGGFGIGTALLVRLEELAKARGMKELKFDSSITAEKFYAKHGYQILERGEHTMRNGMKMPSVKMRKSLV